jgi:hypothetical protein
MFSSEGWTQIKEGHAYYYKSVVEQQKEWDKKAAELEKEWAAVVDRQGPFFITFKDDYIKDRIGERPSLIWTTLVKLYLPALLGASFRGPRPAPQRLYHVTNASLRDIHMSGRLVGRTEGSVYAAEAGASWTGAGNKANTVMFEGEAVSVFKRHPVTGPWSWAKNFGGQFKAPVGDLEIVKAKLIDDVLHIQQVKLVAGLQTPFVSYSRLWTSRLLLEPLAATVPFTSGFLAYKGITLLGDNNVRKVNGKSHKDSEISTTSSYLRDVAPSRFRLLEKQ